MITGPGESGRAGDVSVAADDQISAAADPQVELCSSGSVVAQLAGLPRSRPNFGAVWLDGSHVPVPPSARKKADQVHPRGGAWKTPGFSPIHLPSGDEKKDIPRHEGETKMAASLTINLEESGRVFTQKLDLPSGPLTSEALKGALPTIDVIKTLVREQPAATAKLVQDYSAGRMDAVLATARDLGIVPEERTATDNQAGAGAVVVLIVIAIVLILIFAKPVQAPTKEPSRK
jgi:hypothetical protein